MAQYSLFVLKVPLNSKQTNKQTIIMVLQCFSLTCHCVPILGVVVTGCWCCWLMIGCSGMSQSAATRLEMVGLLCVKDRTHSELVDAVPETCGVSHHDKDYESVIQQVSLLETHCHLQLICHFISSSWIVICYSKSTNEDKNSWYRGWLYVYII